MASYLGVNAAALSVAGEYSWGKWEMGYGIPQSTWFLPTSMTNTNTNTTAYNHHIQIMRTSS